MSEGEIELEAKLKGAAIRKAANERGARFTEAFGEIKVAEVPAKLKEMLDQRHERLRDVFNEWDLDAQAPRHLARVIGQLSTRFIHTVPSCRPS